AAALTNEVEGGDGEELLLPPNSAERTSLAASSGSPNPEENFRLAMFVFTGPEYDALLAHMPKSPANRKVSDVSEAMAQTWTPLLQLLGGSFETRIALDLLGGAAA